MKQSTRDNVIYLAVGLSVAALVAVDFFYAESHERQMWWPSELVFHAVAYMGLLGYFVAKETRKVGASLSQIFTCVLAGSILHLAVVFVFRQTYGGHLGLSLFGIALVEFFVIVQAMVQAVRYLGSE